MITPPPVDNVDRIDPQPPPQDEDTMSTTTEHTGTAQGSNKQQMTEFVAHFVFHSKATNAVTLFANHHATILSTMITAFGDDIRIYSQNNKCLEKIQPAIWSANLTHSKHFTIKQFHGRKNQPTKYIIQHRLYFHGSFFKLKEPLEVRNALCDSNTCLYCHHWMEDIVAMAQPVFLLGLKPRYASNEGALKYVANSGIATGRHEGL